MKERNKLKGTEEQARLKGGGFVLGVERKQGKQGCSTLIIQWLSAVEPMFAGMM